VNHHLTKMIEALDLEIAVIRKKGGGTQVQLRGGERVGQVEGSWLYRFVMAEELNLRDDTPIRIVSGQEDVRGVFVSFKDGVLLAALEEDLGPRIADARLFADESFLIEALKERLENVRAGEAQFNRNAADRVLGLAPPSPGDSDPHPCVNREGTANADQLRAVRRSLGSDITFVWGPPGTGKTTTLARIVEAHYRSGRSVLLVSNTNIAVDTALEKVAERLERETEFDQGLVIRQGPVVKEELRRRFGPQVILGEVVARLGAKLQAKKERYQREMALLEAEEQSLVKALSNLRQLESVRGTLGARQKALEETNATITTRQAEAEQHHCRAARIQSELERARGMGAVRRFLSGVDPDRLAQDVAAATRAARVAEQQARALASKLPALQAEIESSRAEVDRLRVETQGYPPAAEIQTRLGRLRHQVTQVRERIEAIDGQLAQLEQQVLAQCKILATTIYRTYLGKSPARRFDTVVIDEASMLMPPLVYFAAGLSAQSVTVAGDFRQLPPIVASDDPLAEEWLKCDIFEKAGIPERLARRQPAPHLVSLRTQYRMCEPICGIVNELFYRDHPLRSDPSVNSNVSKFPLSATPLLYVDTSPFHPWTAYRTGTYSRYNMLHALLIRNIILHLAETGFLPGAGEPNDAAGVVAPYTAQAFLIQALLDEKLGRRATGVAATVHRFQGNEKHAIVLDLTDSYGVPLGRFLRATNIVEDGARLLNVAASRARQHMIVLGNFEYLRAKAPRDSFVRKLVYHFENHGEALDLDALLPLAERDWIDALHHVLPTNFVLPEGATGAFTEGTFYPAFLNDLARARESIVILSPYATQRGTARWVDSLRAALARGVVVRILTRPASEFGGAPADEVAELVQELRQIGITVDLRARMHEKIAIIDGRVLWHGSLNILSHHDTHESMLRLDSPAACEQLGRFLSTPARIDDDVPTNSLAGSMNPPCPKCGGATVWNQGRFGIWFECEIPDCGGRVSTRRNQRSGGHRSVGGRPRRSNCQSSRRQNRPTPAAGLRRCPSRNCGGWLIERTGRFGPFLGCSNYPKCRYTENHN